MRRKRVRQARHVRQVRRAPLRDVWHYVIVAALMLLAVGAGVWLKLSGPVALASAGGAAPPPAEVTIKLSGTSPSMWDRDYTVTVLDKASGQPVSGVEVTLAADHAEMPGSHPHTIRLKPGAQPGRYEGRITPVMVGPWNVTVTVSGPVTATQSFTDRIELK